MTQLVMGEQLKKCIYKFQFLKISNNMGRYSHQNNLDPLLVCSWSPQESASVIAFPFSFLFFFVIQFIQRSNQNLS